MADYKGLYIDNLSLRLGDEDAENASLGYAQKLGFTTLSLYDIQKILQKDNITADATNALAAFISKARTQYGIVHVAGIAENADFFTNVISAYNKVRTDPNEMIDVYNVEFEFWNMDPISEYYCDDYLTPRQLTCDTNGAYSFFKDQFAAIKQLALADGCICETYVGWPTAAQAQGMLPNADRILVHAYVADPADAYGYVKDRLMYYAQAGKANIIIFSAESEFSGPWLAGHQIGDAYTSFLTAYNATHEPWKQNITLLGYQWYNYTNLAQVPM